MLILKGIIIGIGKIIPGVSGSMLAITLGIYQKLISSINNFFKYPKQNFKFLIKISIGIAISIVFFSNIILQALNKHYIITMFLFIGLIIGGFDDIRVNTSKSDIYIIIISLTIILFAGFMSVDNNVYIDNSVISFLYFVFIGFVDAITTVIPGISGTATLMMLGAYTTLMKSFSTLFDLYYFNDNLKVLIPFFMGFSIGLFLTTKLVDYLFLRYKSKTYGLILGFSIATIILMFIKCFNSFYTEKDLIIATMFFVLGILITKKTNRLLTVD